MKKKKSPKKELDNDSPGRYECFYSLTGFVEVEAASEIDAWVKANTMTSKEMFPLMTEASPCGVPKRIE